ncbi:MAG TPA: hypothetical protein VFT76_02005 [Actinomycetota bacterium]|nr:hypothetical protein [Actinomycetota bacterium]
MIEITLTQVGIVEGRTGSRTIGMLRIDETDPKAEPEQLQPLDGRSLTVVLAGLRKIAADYKRAREEFGEPGDPA